MTGTGAGLSGSIGVGGRLTITTSNRSARPIVLQQSGSGWTAGDLLALAGGPAIDGDPVTWTDHKDGRTYAAARSGVGLILFTNLANGSWTFRNLSAELEVAPALSSALTVFASTDGLVNIAGLSAGGSLILYTQTGLRDGGNNYAWTVTNLSAQHLAPQGLSTPRFVGSLISYVTSWNGMTIAGLDGDGHIQSVWWAPGITQWRSQDLSTITGAPALAGGLTAYLTAWGGVNLVGIDANGDLAAAWWLPEFAGDWRLANLTDEFDGPALTPGSVSSYVTPWGGLNIVGLDDEGRLRAYWWAPALTDSGWQITTLADPGADSSTAPSGLLTGVSNGTTISILGSNADGSILRYWWEVGGEWRVEDLTETAVPR